jgi:integrase
VERARYAWKRLAATFGHLRPDQVNRDTCRTYTAQRRRAGALDGTIIKELSSLRAALRWHDKNTSAIVELPPEPPPKDLYLTRDQYRAFRDAARKIPHLYVFVVTAYSTAGRAAAVLELTWDRADLDAGMIRLSFGERRRKGRAAVPMTDSLREVLEAAKPAALTDHVVEYAGRRVRSVKRAFAAAARRAGVPWCTPHVLRHTAAVHMVESGVPLEEVAQYLGHTSVSVTYRVYARFSPTHLRRAASTLE